jgi:hypothetical protein
MVGFMAYSVISAVILIPTHLLNGLLGWSLVVYMPMFKANKAMLPLLFAGNPLDLRITSDPMGDTQLCVHSSLSIVPQALLFHIADSCLRLDVLPLSSVGHRPYCP